MGKDTRWIIGAILLVVLIVLQIAYLYSQTNIGDGSVLVEYPTNPPATAWEQIQSVELTSNAVENRNLGITATPVSASFNDLASQNAPTPGG